MTDVAPETVERDVATVRYYLNIVAEEDAHAERTIENIRAPEETKEAGGHD